MKNVEYKILQTYWLLIDIAKLYCAILVVVIHCLKIPDGHPIAEGIVKTLSSQSVPFS